MVYLDVRKLGGIASSGDKEVRCQHLLRALPIRHEEGLPVFESRGPAYKMNAPITPLTTLEKAKEIGLKAGLHYVYEGNIADKEKVNTYCPNCGRLLIRRSGFSLSLIHI